MEVLDPRERARGEEVAHLVAPVVEDQRAPVPVLALARVRVFVERGAVESREAVGVLGEMARDPVENHADAGAVQRIDERPEVVGGAEAAGRREEPGDLVAPRSVVGELEHRQQLDVREADALYVGDEPCGQFLVGQELAVVHRGPTTRGAPRRSPSAGRAPRGVRTRCAIQSPSCQTYWLSPQTIDAVAGGNS